MTADKGTLHNCTALFGSTYTDKFKGKFRNSLDIFWEIFWVTYIGSYWLKMNSRKYLSTVHTFLRAGSASAQLVYGSLWQNQRDGVGVVLDFCEFLHQKWPLGLSKDHNGL